MQRFRARSALATGALALVATLGCSSTGQAPPPDDFTVVFGEGGGITGRWQGYLLAPDGTLSEWSGMGVTNRTDETKVRTLSEKEMSELWAKVVELDVLANANTAYGNMSRAMHITENGSTHDFAWPTPVSDGGESPAQQLYDTCNALAKGGNR